MKFCSSWCVVAIIFFIANVYVAFTADKGLLKRDFYSVLSESQINTYNKLTRERRMIYLQGYAFGFILALVFILLSKNYRGGKLLNTGIICFAGAITLVFNYLYYMLYPKSDYMVLHLQNIEQKQAWLNIYKHMQFKYHTGLVFGILASMLFAKSTC